jgi:hypothetical protein
MGYRNRRLPVVAVAAAVLALGSGCATGDANKATSNKPDVLKLGVLPPPQETLNTSAAPGGSAVAAGAVVPAGGAEAAAPATPPPTPPPTPLVAAAPVAPPAPSGPTLPKISLRSEKKVVPTEIAVAWRSNIDYLPDPARNGAMGPGLAGQLFLFGGPKLEFAPADGVLTVDLVDETPRPAGQPAATPERWQFTKDMLRNLVANNDTFGKSYVLFLPWPAYRPDVTRVKIGARYDPDGGGYPLYVPPSTVSLGKDAPVIDRTSSVTTGVLAAGLPAQPFAGGTRPTSEVPFGALGGSPAPSNYGPPIPIGGGSSSGAGAFQNPLGGGAFQPSAPPLSPAAPGASAGTMPLAPVAPAGGPPVGVGGTR